jgi:protein SCO1
MLFLSVQHKISMIIKVIMAEIRSKNNKKKNDVTTQTLYGIIIALIIGIIGISLYIVFDRLSVPENDGTSSNDVDIEDIDGSIAIDPPHEMPDFTLTNQDGDLVNLTAWRGKYVLITFGYTHCPDVCPLTLNEFRRIRDSLGDLAKKVEFVFISVDGQRDTPDAIKQYFETRKLDGLIGLTGEEADLQTLGTNYGLFFEIGDNTSKGGYLVSHTAGSFLLNPEGRWIMRYQFGALPSMIVKDLEIFINP